MAAKTSAKKPGTRSAGRTLAFQVLFGLPFVSEQAAQNLAGGFDDNPAVLAEQRESVREFARLLTCGAAERMAEVDATVQDHSANWKLSRMGKVELAVLRLAVYEMLYTDIPLRAALNEAIELSKRFGDDASPTFVNGILDAVAKDVDKGRYDIEKSM